MLTMLYYHLFIPTHTLLHYYPSRRAISKYFLLRHQCVLWRRHFPLLKIKGALGAVEVPGDQVHFNRVKEIRIYEGIVRSSLRKLSQTRLPVHQIPQSLQFIAPVEESLNAFMRYHHRSSPLNSCCCDCVSRPTSTYISIHAPLMLCCHNHLTRNTALINGILVSL